MEKVSVLNTKAQIFKLGSIYLDDLVIYPGFSCSSGDFTIGDTVADMELRWIQMGNALVADRCVCLGISWDTLNSLGYIFGRPVHIDGKPYLCRSLKVGIEETASSEWDTLLKIESANTLIHWKNIYFWGQETILKRYPERRAVRGFLTAHNWAHRASTYQDQDIGFRPVLEPLFSGALQTLIGSNIKLFGPLGEAFTGRLVEYDDYDMILDTVSESPSICGWVSQVGSQVIVQRENIIGIKEAKAFGES